VQEVFHSEKRNASIISARMKEVGQNLGNGINNTTTEYQSIRLVHLQTFLSIIFIMVFNEISIFDDVHQTVVNSGIETTYRSGALEFTSLFEITVLAENILSHRTIHAIKN
jgi:hypothetical protein